MEMHLTRIPVAKAGMLIRKPVDEVYEAFVNPAITRKFWFSKSSSKLETGKRIRWDWEMYGVSSTVEVKVLEPRKLISLVWGIENQPTMVEFLFNPRSNDTTWVDITNSGFTGSGDEVVEMAMNSSAGFGLVLAGLKAYLEHGIELNLVADRFPDKIL